MTDAGIDSPASTATLGSAALALENVSKVFIPRDGQRVEALLPLDLTVGAGEFISIVGPSGCGKSTLLRVSANLETPTTGRVLYRGRPGGIAAGEYGMVFQSPGLFPWKTVRGNIAMAQRIVRNAPAASSADINARVDHLISLMQLPMIADRYPTELSGGMQQRVSIARALYLDPTILLMDEPFGALDALTREELNLHFERIQMNERKTVLFVTHSISEAVILSDRIVVMSASPGRIVEIVQNDLPRPRNETVMASEAFTARVARIRSLLQTTSTGE
jgi:NitT/TauT family transport system ATP-binding protein